MAEATPRRGGTIAEKIAQFRSAGGSKSSKRTTKEDNFWWQNVSPSRPDAQPRAHPHTPQQFPPQSPDHIQPASSLPKASRHSHDTDADFRGIDQIQFRATACRTAGAAAPPSAAVGASIAALQRLAQEHPTLYHAVMSLERRADGGLSETALQLLDQALMRSGAPASRHIGIAAAVPVDHTTTTIMLRSPNPPPSNHHHQQQQKMRQEVQARAQVVLAAASTAARASISRSTELDVEESMGQLLARYRRREAHDGLASADAAHNRPSTAAGLMPLPSSPQPTDAAGRAPATPGTSSGIATSSSSTSAAATIPARNAPPRNHTPEAPPHGDLRPGPTAERKSQPQGQPLAAGLEAPGGTSANSAQAAPHKKPTIAKLQKILQLANMASQLGGGPLPTSDSGGTVGRLTPPAVVTRESADAGAAGGSEGRDGGSPPQQHQQADAVKTRRSRAHDLSGNISFSAGDLEAEPSLSSMEAPAAASTRRSSDLQSLSDAHPHARQGPAGSASSPAALTDAAARTKHEGEAGAAVRPQAAAAAESVVNAVAAGSSTSAVASNAVATAAGVVLDDHGAGGVAADAASKGFFAFPVTAGTAVDPEALMSRARMEMGTAVGAATTTTTTARRVQFSPNEPQVRLYSEGTAAGASTPPPPVTLPPPAAATSPGALPQSTMQPVLLLPAPTPSLNPMSQRPTHIFVPTDPALPPALVAVPGFEPVPPGSVKASQAASQGRRQSPGSRSGSPPRRDGRRSASTSPPRGSTPAKSTTASTSATASATTAATIKSTGKKPRSEVDRVLDSDSDSDGAGGRIPAGLALEMKAAEQAAAQVEKELQGHTPNRLTRLLDEVAAFRRTEGERLLREGERLKMMEELKAMSVDKLSALLGPNSELLKEISQFRNLYTGNLEQVKASADNHTRAVLDALQRTGEAATAVKEAVVESALRQQDEVLALVDRVAPLKPPPLTPRSPLLTLPPQMLYGGAPAASDLLNPSWWSQLLHPTNRASLANNGLAAPDAVAGSPAEEAEAGLQPVAVAGNLLAHQVAGLSSAIRASVDSAGGLVGGELGVQENMSVSAITRAARQVSLTLDMAVREYIDRTTSTTTAQPSGQVGLLHPAALTTMTAAATATPSYPLHTAATALSASQQLLNFPSTAAVSMTPLAGSPFMALSPSTVGGASQGQGQGQGDPWVVHPVTLPPVLLPDGNVVQQPVSAAAAAAFTAGQVAAPTTFAVASTPPTLYTLQPQPPHHCDATSMHAPVQPPAPPNLSHHQHQPAIGVLSVPAASISSATAAAAAPQLLAVQGPLPAGGASGTALLNLPNCAPPPACWTSAEGLAQAGCTATPTTATLPLHLSTASQQPGEGLPYRLDLQLVRVLPPAPSPQPQEWQQLAWQHQLPNQQEAWQQPPQLQWRALPVGNPYQPQVEVGKRWKSGPAGPRLLDSCSSHSSHINATMPSLAFNGAASYNGYSRGIATISEGDNCGYRAEGYDDKLVSREVRASAGTMAGHSLEGNFVNGVSSVAVADAGLSLTVVSDGVTLPRSSRSASRHSSRSPVRERRGLHRGSRRSSSSESRGDSSSEGSAAGRRSLSITSTVGVDTTLGRESESCGHGAGSGSCAGRSEYVDSSGGYEGNSKSEGARGRSLHHSRGSKQHGRRGHRDNSTEAVARKDRSARTGLGEQDYNAQSSRPASREAASQESSWHHFGSHRSSLVGDNGERSSAAGSEPSLAAGIAELKVNEAPPRRRQPQLPPSLSSSSHPPQLHHQRQHGLTGASAPYPSAESQSQRPSLISSLAPSSSASTVVRDVAERGPPTASSPTTAMPYAAWKHDHSTGRGVHTRAPGTTQAMLQPGADGALRSLSQAPAGDTAPVGTTSIYCNPRSMPVPSEKQPQGQLPTLAVAAPVLAFAGSDTTKSWPSYVEFAWQPQAAAAVPSVAAVARPVWGPHNSSAVYGYPNPHYHHALNVMQPSQDQQQHLEQEQRQRQQLQQLQSQQRSPLPQTQTQSGMRTEGVASSNLLHGYQPPSQLPSLPWQAAASESLQPPIHQLSGQSTAMGHQVQQQQLDGKRVEVASPMLRALPAMPSAAVHSEEVQRAYQATLAQLEAVYQAPAQG